MELALIAKYPFLKAARELLKDAPVNEHSLNLARERVLAALAKRKHEATTAAEPRDRLASFALARCMLAVIKDRFATRKWASREANAMAAQLAEEDRIVLDGIAKEILPTLHHGAYAEEYSVDVFDYLNYGSSLASENLEKGKVFLEKDGLVRLLEDAIATRLSNVEAINPTRLPKEITEAAKQLEPAVQKASGGSGYGGSGYSGSSLALPCVQKLMKGVEEGKRYYGAMSLAMACMKDKLSFEKAGEIMNNYAANCQKGAHPFTQREAINTLEWVYRRGRAGLSCKRLRDEGIATEEICAVCVKRKRARAR